VLFEIRKKYSRNLFNLIFRIPSTWEFNVSYCHNIFSITSHISACPPFSCCIHFSLNSWQLKKIFDETPNSFWTAFLDISEVGCWEDNASSKQKFQAFNNNMANQFKPPSMDWTTPGDIQMFSLGLMLLRNGDSSLQIYNTSMWFNDGDLRLP